MHAATRDFTVARRGTDTSGRPVFMTTFMHEWWEGVVAELGFRPTVVQGAFMTRVAGGGAAASAGYHDLGGCLDVRTWDLSPSQLDALVRTTRTRGGASWRRDLSAVHGGMESHCHITLGADRPLSSGAAESWRSYLAGDNGLANNAPDYEWRPEPLVTKPPPEDDMADPTTQAQLDRIQAAAEAAQKASEQATRMLDSQRERQHTQTTRLREKLDRAIATGQATKAELQAMRADLDDED